MKKKLTKIVSTVVTMATVLSVPATAFAVITYPNGGKWNRGYTNPGNGYYMAYSYYDHGTRKHYTFAGDANGSITYSKKGLGTTCANGKSTRSTNKVVGYDWA